MRAVSLLPMAISAVLVAACGSETASVLEREEAAARAPAPPERDLTLQAPPVAAAEVASAVELSRPQPPPASVRSARPQPRPKHAPSVAAPAPEPVAAPAAAPVPAPLPTLAEVLAEPAPEEAAAAGGRELAPGRTVTIIPTSSGPSLEADEDDAWLPSERPRGILVGGGGTCRPRGGVRGIGIAGRIPVGVPGRRLR